MNLHNILHTDNILKENKEVCFFYLVEEMFTQSYFTTSYVYKSLYTCSTIVI